MKSYIYSLKKQHNEIKTKVFEHKFGKSIFTVTFVIFSLLVILCIAIFFRNISNNKLHKEYVSASQQVIKLSESIDNANMFAGTYLTDLVRNELLKKDYDDLSTSQKINISNSIFSHYNKYTTPTPYLHSTYIYYTKSGKIISDVSGVEDMDMATNKQILNACLSKQLDSQAPNTLFVPSTDGGYGVITHYRNFYDENYAPLGFVAVSVDLDSIMNSLTTTYLKENILIADNNGNIIHNVHIDNDVFTKLYSEPDVNSLDTTGLLSASGRRYVILPAEKNVSGWFYAVPVSQSPLMHIPTFILFIVFVALGILISRIAGIYFTYFCCSSMFSILNKHSDMLISDHSDGIYGNEMQLLEKIVDDLRKINTLAKEDLKLRDSFILQCSLIKLCYGGKLSSTEEFVLQELETRHSFGADTRFAAFIMLLSGQDINDEKFSIKDLFNISKDFSITISAMNETQIIGLISFNVSKNIQSVYDMLDSIVERVNAYGIEAYIGVGSICKNINEYKSSYESAVNSITNLTNTVCDNVSEYDNLHPSSLYTRDIHYQLISALKQGKTNEAIQILDNIYYQMLSMHLPVGAFTDFFWTTVSSIANTLCPNNSDWYTMIKKNYYDCYSEFHQITNIIDIRTYIINIVTNISEQLSAQSNPSINYGTDYTTNKIKEYIETHYSEPLSLDELAAHVKISKSYLSTIFKMSAGIGIKDYITNLKLSKAAELLVTSNKNVTEIISMVGYDTPRGFQRAFKNKYGVSASEYRRLHTK